MQGNYPTVSVPAYGKTASMPSAQMQDRRDGCTPCCRGDAAITCLECCKGVRVRVQDEPDCAEVAPAELLQHNIAPLLELLAQPDWMVTTCNGVGTEAERLCQLRYLHCNDTTALCTLGPATAAAMHAAYSAHLSGSPPHLQCHWCALCLHHHCRAGTLCLLCVHFCLQGPAVSTPC